MIQKNNLEVLKNAYPHVYEKLINMDSSYDGDYMVVNGPNTSPTLKIIHNQEQFFLHSKYDPMAEARKFVEEYHDHAIDSYIIYGFGFAYHIREMMEKNKDAQIFVLETNKKIFKAAMENIDLRDILTCPNVKIYLEDNLPDFADRLKQLLSIDSKKLIIHSPSLKAMPNELREIKYLLENYKIHENTIKRFGDQLAQNFAINIQYYDKNVDILFKKFQGIPIIIVSAGPSLDKNKHLLREAKGKAIIFAVGTALKPLFHAGIHPDLAVITDPQDIVYNQLEGLDIEIPLIILSTCNRKVAQNYKGIKFLALQQGFELAERYSRQQQHQLIRTGGSVSTTALDIAIRFGCNPIIFAGQDLAYTYGKSHVKGTYFYKEIEEYRSLRAVPGNEENVVYTSSNLYAYLKWIERRVREEKNIRFINATEGGALIEGTEIMTLQEVNDTILKGSSHNILMKLRELVKNE
ncbi:motility associated factor glycosyltransferase family protein [Thermotalea metallivorans]|uniref:DUF115 domain-containing protein n=1 Tax=Thermotalea metallivorans TaxID=520762 RepID=A0A140L718_9FIRM|nr:6-hydroxymethylpterin diphosphokinase MptE-like protein [Thermotalea metallivorans]KXG76343.1 hypothetical protein AN619_13010 [Thermotalea metallivorans]